MKPKKSFDCVRMKSDAQAVLQQEEASMKWWQRNKRTEARALDDPVLGNWFRAVAEERSQVPMLHERAAKYHVRPRKKP